jgi:rhamnose transport system permease protein
MSKIMMSEEMKKRPAAPSPLRRLLCWEGFLLAVTLAVFVATPWRPLLPQYLEPVGRHL